MISILKWFTNEHTWWWDMYGPWLYQLAQMLLYYHVWFTSEQTWWCSNQRPLFWLPSIGGFLPLKVTLALLAVHQFPHPFTGPKNYKNPRKTTLSYDHVNNMAIVFCFLWYCIDVARFVQTWGIPQWTAFFVMGKVLFYDFDLSSIVGHVPIWRNHRLSTSFCMFTPWCPIFGAVLEPNFARITFWLPSCQMSGWHLGSHGSPLGHWYDCFMSRSNLWLAKIP